MNNLEKVYEYMKQLREDDNQEETEEEKEQEQEVSKSLHGSPDSQQEVPMTDENFKPMQDGQIPQNSEGIVSGQYDALNGIGTEQITFQQGNYNQVAGYPKLVSDKVTSFTQTLVPLVEVALIELLGNNQMYNRQSCQCALSFQNNQIQMSFSMIYVVNSFIGTDIDMAALQHDSNYVLNRIRPVGANISKCEINTTDGTVTIQGII